MISGMTGFGNAQINHSQFKAIVELKSVNHRYLDVSYYFPVGMNKIEAKVRKIIQNELFRGRLTVSIKFLTAPPQKVVLKKEKVKTYLDEIKSLCKEFRLENDIKASDLIRLPGVLDVQDVFIANDDFWKVVEPAFSKALRDLKQMRVREGRALNRHLKTLLVRMGRQVRIIEARVKKLLKEWKTNAVSDDEFRALQKSNDINEELTRLSHYIDETLLMLDLDVSIGKKIDFVAQEMQRETNTIGSKLQDNIVSDAVIALKSKVEKIREQAQNIE